MCEIPALVAKAAFCGLQRSIAPIMPFQPLMNWLARGPANVTCQLALLLKFWLARKV
jgi:hypothetical protein